MICPRCGKVIIHNVKVLFIHNCSVCGLHIDSQFQVMRLTLSKFSIHWNISSCYISIIEDNKLVLAGIHKNIPYDITEEKLKLILAFL